MANEFKIKHGFVSTGNGTVEGEIRITGAAYADNGSRIATRAWATQYLADNNYLVSNDLPTNVSAFTNDAGYLTSYTETDTLNTVTSRGSTTNGRINLGSATSGAGLWFDRSSAGSYWFIGLNGTDGTSLRWYQSGDKMSLSNTGNLSVTGTMSANGGNSTNWNTAYSWGNHASAGYLTTVAFGDITGTPTTLAGYGITDAFDGAYSSLTGIPTSFTPSAHTHSIDQVDGLQAELDAKQPAGNYLTSYTETDTLDSVADRGATTNQALTIGNVLTLQKSSGVARLSTTTVATDPQFIEFNEATYNAGYVWIAVSDDFDVAASNDVFYIGDSSIDTTNNWRFKLLGNGSAYLKVGSVDEQIATRTWVTAQSYLTAVPAEYLTQTEGDARYDSLGSAGAVNDRIDNDVIPNIPTNNNQLTNGAGYITDGNTGWNNTYGFITASDSITGNAATATKLATARNIALSGAVTGNANFDGSGNITIATTATSDPTLTLAGDASGSATFTNLGNATLTVTIADDSHNHIISNIDGLQTALDGKLSTGHDMTLTLSGDASGSATFTNMGNATLSVTVANDSHTHDGRYYTESESDARFVNVTGDTITGDLLISGASLGVTSTAQGTEAFYVDGVNGRLFTISDDLSDSLFSVNTISGLPVIEAFADNTVNIGPFSNPVTIDSSGVLAIGGVTAATQTYVDTAITNLIGGAPGALDTLNELAAAINDDASFASSVTSSLALKAPLASPALTGTPTAPTAATATNSTQIATTAFVKAQGYVTTDTNYYLNGISRSGNTLTFSVNGATNQTYTFGSAAWSATTAFDAAGSASTAEGNAISHTDNRIDNEVIPMFAGYQPSGNYFTDGDTVLNMANNDGLVYNDTNNLMYIKADGTDYPIIDSRGGTITGILTLSGSGTKLALNNGDITGVNQITINDPGEGIVWTSGASGSISLATIDDSTDNILNVAGTGASLAVNGATVATQDWVAAQGYITSSGANYYVDGLSFDTGNGILTASVNGTTNQSVDLDGRYLQLGGGTVSGNVHLNGEVRLGNFTGNDTQEWPKVYWYRDTPNGWDEGLIKADSSRGFFNKSHYGIHFDATRAFGFFTSSWTKILGMDNTQVHSSVNLVVDGTISASGYNDSNWNTAYNWGNHASAGYASAVDLGSVNDRIDNEVLPIIETPAITSNGSTPSLNSGITAAEVRSLIGAQAAGSYLTSYTESDTLETVTGRGNTTAGDINVKGDILLTGGATTTNQARTIDFTGFDKEGTTDYSDRAYIQHTTGTGGHSGSVLVISSMNDASDGIAFLTNASSKLKHNSNNIATENWVTAQSYLTTSGKAADSNLLDGLDLHTGRNNEANKVVRTDGNGYIQAGWINTPSGTAGTINKIYCSQDDYVRYLTPANFRAQVTDGVYQPAGSYLTTTGKAADSNLLDGLDSSAFLRSNANDTATGVISFNAGINTLSINDTSGQQLVICAGEAGIDASQTGELVYVNAENGFQVAASNDNWATGYAGTKKTIIDYGGIRYDGNYVWHAGNFNPANYQPVGNYQPAGTYNTIIGTDSDINTSGSTIIDNIYVTDGVITSMGTRTLTAADLGIAKPAPPQFGAANIVGETVEVVFDQSPTSGVDSYQVWSSAAGGAYGLIANIPTQDIAATMTAIDAVFSVSGEHLYRVYAIKNGIYSDPAEGGVTYTASGLDVVNMSVVNLNTAYYIQYDMPDSRFVDHIEIYMDAEASSGNLSRTGATLIYSGNNTSYMYQIGAADLDKFHQFWVEVVES